MRAIVSRLTLLLDGLYTNVFRSLHAFGSRSSSYWITLEGVYPISADVDRLSDNVYRCFVYLFPATQTWVLALVMLSLT